MPLPFSGPMSMEMIQAEFGGDYAMSSYYRNGANVPNLDENQSIPTSGAISFNQFYGTSKTPPNITVPGGNAFSSTTIPGGQFAFARFEFTSLGVINRGEGIGGVGETITNTGPWIDRTNSAGFYDIRADLISGVTPELSAVNTWLSLSTGRQWRLSLFVEDTIVCVLNIKIRHSGSGTVLASADYTITAQVVVISMD